MQNIAVFNAGSSSIKFAVFDYDGTERVQFHGQFEDIGVAPRLIVEGADGEQLIQKVWNAADITHKLATSIILETSITLLGGKPIQAVGHRVVHGGTRFAAPVEIDRHIVDELDELAPLAPLHQPHNLAPIKTIARAAPHLPQVACFDTAFHQAQPNLSQIYALPRMLTDSGIRRYGFHGLSYEYVSERLAEIAPEHCAKRIIMAHLGNGASLCAIHHGRSVATTMGFTAVEGLMMGSRCGALDPGVLLYLIEDRNMDAKTIETLIYKESGLLGVSGISSDMRVLRASSQPAAAQAISLFVYRIVREIGSLAAALEGLDGLVFTGGIGQRDAKTRQEVVAGCGWLGASLDERANSGKEGRIDGPLSRIPIWVIATDEERVIARQTARVLGLQAEAAIPLRSENILAS
jgi:acetate kinase